MLSRLSAVCFPPRGVYVRIELQYTTGSMSEKYPIDARKIPVSCQNYCVLAPYNSGYPLDAIRALVSRCLHT